MPAPGRRQARVRAPELRGAGGWIGSPDLTLAGLRGKIVLLDFWTARCVNCVHVLEELREIERDYADTLVVVGVHSPKFPHETGHEVVVDAVRRLGIGHPVLDDPGLQTWNQYAVRAWPTLVVIDPAGYVVATMSGEGHGAALRQVLDGLVADHAAVLERGAVTPVTVPAAGGELLFPVAAVRLPDGSVLVSDSGHHSLAVLDGDRVVRRLGTGRRGLRDGATPELARPQGMCLLPDGSVLVADTGNHCLRRLNLSTWTLETVAGTGRQLRRGQSAGGPARGCRLSSPSAVAVWRDEVVVAMTGCHQLWAYDGEQLRVLAGTGAEGLRDGPAHAAYLAQPGGLAPGLDRLWFVDAETSALRWYRDGEVGTAAGSGLFDFGHRDGQGQLAQLQHPLGVTALDDGTVVVCDTYNGALRAYDSRAHLMATLAGDLAEPTSALVVQDRLLVVESAAHRLTSVLLPHRVSRPASPQGTALAPGPVRLLVQFEPGPGRRLSEPPAATTVRSSPPGLLIAGVGPQPVLDRELVLDGRYAGGVLHVSATASTCDDGGEHPACHLARQKWAVPVVVAPGGAASVQLRLEEP